MGSNYLNVWTSFFDNKIEEIVDLKPRELSASKLRYFGIYLIIICSIFYIILFMKIQLSVALVVTEFLNITIVRELTIKT